MKKIFFLFVVAALIFGAVSPAFAQEAVETREEKLLRLDGIYRQDGLQAWMAQIVSGPVTLTEKDARQVEEETIVVNGETRVVISGVQLKDAQGIYVPWPAVVTTDQLDRVVTNRETRQYTPDPLNGSTLYTNVTVSDSGDGLVTLWADATNWSQMWPEGYVAPVAPTSNEVTPATEETEEVVTVVGQQGPVGSQGPVGPQGEQGVQGPIGPQGAQGAKGEDGKNAPLWAFWLVGGIALASLIVGLWPWLSNIFAGDDNDEDGDSASAADTKTPPTTPTPPVATSATPITAPEKTELEKAQEAVKEAEQKYKEVLDRPYQGKNPAKMQNYDIRKAAAKKELEEAKAAVEKLQPSAA